MGKGGFAPKPTAIRKAEGNRGKRPYNQQEPVAVKKIPPCPKHLDDKAKTEWRWISKRLLEMGCLGEIDKAQLALYCQAYSRWEQAEEQIQTSSLLYRDAKTNAPKINPYLKVANAAMDQLNRYLQQFGMSPSSRTQIKADMDNGEQGSAIAFGMKRVK